MRRSSSRPRKTGGEDWEPKNYDGKFDGPMRVRTALAKSKNLVTVRVLQAIGPQYAQDYIARFGFDPKLHPPYLTMGLGAGSVTPLQMVGAYAVFANGGYRVTPYLIAQDRRRQGQRAVRGGARPSPAKTRERAIDPRNAWIMTSLLKDVIRVGTGDARAVAQPHATSPARPARPTRTSTPGSAASTRRWSASSWIGFDQPKTLGTNETGAVAALPIWISYMAKALKGMPEAEPADARRHRRGHDQRRHRAARRRERAHRILLRGVPAARPRRQPRRRRRPGAGKDIRDQLF